MITLRERWAVWGRAGRRSARRWLLTGVTRGLNRLRPLAPPSVWFVLVALRSAAGSGPLLTRPHARRALVLAPHPDDETIGCGGCVALLADAGADVRVLVASAGEASVGDASAASTGAARAEELGVACGILGATVEGVLSLPDGGLSGHEEAVTAAVDAVVARFRPDVVFAPWPLDEHPDHRAVCRALAACPSLERPTEIWCYEVWAALVPNRLVDISSSWERKRRALKAHVSAGASFDPTAHLALNRWRSIAGLGGVGQAEAYLVLTPDELRRLIRGL
jgi:LmbE family N-acetylglucosaminyl deacetylase